MMERCISCGRILPSEMLVTRLLGRICLDCEDFERIEEEILASQKSSPPARG